MGRKHKGRNTEFAKFDRIMARMRVMKDKRRAKYTEEAKREKKNHKVKKRESGQGVGKT